MSRRILILHTGGTIGMVPSENGYVPGANLGELLADRLGGRQAELPRFEVQELDHLIDSANLTPSDWTRIARPLIDQWEHYDGFVVLHGTDTMAYTASALSYLLRGCDRPVILTGSQIPLGLPRTDALDNVTTALVLAASEHIHEVCLCFRGRLLRGNRARKLKTSGLDAFDSPNAPALGRAGIELELRRDLLLPPGHPDFQLPDMDANAVAVLALYPGIPARLVEATLALPGLKGLILHTFGAGNAPDANPALIQALADGIERGIAVINISQCPIGGVSQKAYASGAALDGIGVVAGGDLTPEAAFAKLHVLLAGGVQGEDLRRQFQAPRAGDSTPATPF
ncbi:type I asparaginase [Marinobacter sp. C2H3]|uniref:type I asparaginase n=1 Tax=Marinobacter sp. C2H3 TaxID=3119003 RepID=UPI00300F1D33